MTSSDDEKAAFYHEKMFAALQEVQQLQSQLIGQLSLEHLDADGASEPSIAFANVLRANEKALNNIKLLNLPQNKVKIYDVTGSSKVLLPVIIIKSLDVSLQYDIMLTIDGLPIQKSHNGKCVKCDRINLREICCSKCVLCNECNYAAEQKCAIFLLKYNLWVEKAFRNLVGHLTTEEVKLFLQQKLMFPDFPGKHTWGDLGEVIINAAEGIWTYMCGANNFKNISPAQKEEMKKNLDKLKDIWSKDIKVKCDVAFRRDLLLAEEVTKLSTKLKEDTKKKHKNIYGKCDWNSNQLPKANGREATVVDLSFIKDATRVFSQGVIKNIEEEEETGRTTTDMISDMREQLLKKAASPETPYDDIITSTKDYVIISAAPGCGKTTLSETLAYKWAKGNLWMDFQFVFTLKFRDIFRFKNDETVTAEKILLYYYPDQFANPSVMKKAETLLILDGFDEFSNKHELLSKHNEFANYTRAVFELLDPHNPQLRFARIITSRPTSCTVLLRVLRDLQFTESRFCEIIGFSSYNMRNYIKQFFSLNHDTNSSRIDESSRRKSDTLLGIIEENEILRPMMTIPFYCCAVCCLHYRNGINLNATPITFTGLFCNLLTMFIRDHGLRNGKLTFDEVVQTPETKPIILTLSQFAFYLEKQQKIIFLKRDYEKFFDDALSGENSSFDFDKLIDKTGMILKIDRDHMNEPMYQFLHYSFHEFLVALYAFHIASIEGIENNYILSMVAGLIGGSVEDSHSEPIVKTYAKLFASTSNTIKLIDLEFHEIHDFLDILHEYQNETHISTPVFLETKYFSVKQNFHLKDLKDRVVVDNIFCKFEHLPYFGEERLHLLRLISTSLTIFVNTHLHSSMPYLDFNHKVPRIIVDRIILNQISADATNVISLVEHVKKIEIIDNVSDFLIPACHEDIKHLNHPISMIFHMRIQRLNESITNRDLQIIISYLRYFCRNLTTVTLAIYDATHDTEIRQNNQHVASYFTKVADVKALLKGKGFDEINNLKFALSCVSECGKGKDTLASKCFEL